MNFFSGKPSSGGGSADRMRTMLDMLPTNVMTIDPQTCIINYVNARSIETLKKVEHLLPCKAVDIMGQNIDIFHKQPSYQRNILADKPRVTRYQIDWSKASEATAGEAAEQGVMEEALMPAAEQVPMDAD